MDSVQPFPDANRIVEEPVAMLRPMVPLEENYWPVIAWTPSCDIYETESELVLMFELPGVKKEDLEVALENHTLTLRGERKFDQMTDHKNYRRIECHYGKFTRSFKVPMFADATVIEAEFNVGVLIVTVSKREESQNKRE